MTKESLRKKIEENDARRRVYLTVCSSHRLSIIALTLLLKKNDKFEYFNYASKEQPRTCN